MLPWRTTLWSPTPGYRLVLTKGLEQQVVEYRWALQGPSSWRRPIQGKAEGNYLIALVVLQKSWTGYLEVSSLRTSWRASACWPRWEEKINLINPPWSVLGVHWLYWQLDLKWRHILSELPGVTSYVGIEYFWYQKWSLFRQRRSWSLSSSVGTLMVWHFQKFVLLVRKSQMRLTPDLSASWSWWCCIILSFLTLP